MGTVTPKEYRRGVYTGEFQDPNFGESINIDGDQIVADASEDNSNKGSINVFMWSNTTEAEGGKKWVQVGKRVHPKDLCGAEFYGYSVQVRGDLITASADCKIKVKLCCYDRDGSNAVAGNVVLL